MPTVRQEIILLLEDADRNAGDLSRMLRIPEKEVYLHLTSIARTVSSRGKKLVVLPFRCISCGFEFKSRTRFTKPGRCPVCKKTYVETPVYRIIPTNPSKTKGSNDRPDL